MSRKMPDKQNKILPVVIVCFAMYLLYGIYFTAFGANSRNMMRFFDIAEGRQGMIMTVQSIGCLVMGVLLGLFGERINKLYGLLTGLIIMGIASIAIGTMTIYTVPGSGYGLLLFYALVGGIGYIMIDLLMNGAIADIYPDKEMGYMAALAAFESENGNYKDGKHGCGCGATVGKLLGMDRCTKSGIGSYAVQLGDLKVGAIVCTNAIGDIYDYKTGKRIAGVRTADGKKANDLSCEELMYDMYANSPLMHLQLMLMPQPTPQ